MVVRELGLCLFKDTLSHWYQVMVARLNALRMTHPEDSHLSLELIQDSSCLASCQIFLSRGKIWQFCMHL